MKQADELILRKILSEIQLGLSFVDDLPLDEFLENEILKRATCMTIINIGELIKHLSIDVRQEYKHIPWKEIAGFRDIAAHKYQTLRMNDVYTTITGDFPVLLKEIECVLGKEVE